MTAAPFSTGSGSARPLLLDTDIGTDIDDAYALILAAVSPEFDLRLVTVVNNDVALRARIARRILDLLGRRDVLVGVGMGASLTPDEHRGWMGHEGKGIDLSEVPEPSRETEAATANVAGYAPWEAAHCIALCAQECADAGTPLTVCPIGALTNLALALRDYPEQTRHIGQIIAMAANFEGYGPENARTGHNIACDPVAAAIVLQSGLPITLIGLNVTQQTAMTLADVEALEAIGGPLADALTGMHRVWFEAIHNTRSPMHDGLTLAQQIDPAILTFAPAYCSVGTAGEEQGKVFYTEGTPLDPSTAEEALLTPPCRVALTVDVPRYHALLQNRVQAAVRQARNRPQG